MTAHYPQDPFRPSVARVVSVLALCALTACGGISPTLDTSESDTAAGAHCGDGVEQPELGETCDDGNTVPGDGCSETCHDEDCGNGDIDGDEECDGETGCDELTCLWDVDEDLIADTTEGTDDADSDGTPNAGDDDADGDGIPDIVEAGDDNILTDPVDTDGDTIPDFLDTDANDDGLPDSQAGAGDSDLDGIPNYLDDDIDGDNLLNADEGAYDPDGDGKPAYDDLDSDGDGIGDVEEGLTDSDGDTVPDYLDSDSDNDGIPDAVEGGGDTDSDGTPDYLDLDSDDDGWPDTFEAGPTPASPLDTDGDSTPDYLDLDSDGDFLTDALELAAGTAPRQIDTDGDGINDFDDGVTDFDGDGIINALDSDSDNDGVPDSVEAGDSDPTTPPVNSDFNGYPDFLDRDSDNDGLLDAAEVYCSNLGLSARVFDDTDGDGFSDLAETAIGSDVCDPASGILDIVEFYFELPYQGPQYSDVLVFEPTVKKADIFFNVDTTASMGGEIDNLQAGLSTIMTATSARVGDPAFGVSRFDDFPASGYGSSGDVPFGLLRGVTVTQSQAQTGVNALDAPLHSGNDFPESGYEALFQVADGGGVSGSGGTFGPFTTTGRIGGARFRSNSLPIVFHITDALSHGAGIPTTLPGCISWVADYPAGYNAHTKAQAFSALTGIGARVITVQTMYGAACSGQLDVSITAQTREISETTGAVVPQCAFKMDATNWRCGPNTCCDGTIPDGAGNCILRYGVNESGNGLTDAAVDGIDAIIKYATFDVFTTWRDDGSTATLDTGCFIKQVESLVFVPPPAEPESSCTPAATPAPFNGSTYDNGFVGFATGTSSNTRPGSQLQFTVLAENDTCAPATSSPQLFTAYIDITDDTTGQLLDTQTVVILVPPTITD